MRTKGQKIVAAAFATTVAIAVAMVVNLTGQQASQISGDFRNATTAEIRDAQGTVLLRGTFTQVAGDSESEVERQATLAPVAAGGTAAGDAEVEYQKDKPDVQEVEFNVTGVPARAILTLVLDGRDVFSATANDKGEVEAEANVTVGQRP
jgi:hypothetical protein